MELNIRDIPVSIITAVGTSLLTQYLNYCDDNDLEDYKIFFHTIDNNNDLGENHKKRFFEIRCKNY